MIRHPKYNWKLMQFSILNGVPGIRHFSTSRRGGVSRGEYRAFNLGINTGDQPERVRRNYTKLAEMLNCEIDDIIVPLQIHGSDILLIDNDFVQLHKTLREEWLRGFDAIISQQKNLFFCVATADCVPILLYDFKTKAVAVIHAGWRGTVDKIVEKTITAMQENFGTVPKNLLAAIGPAIGIKNYEVGNEVVQKFREAGFTFNERTYRDLYRDGRIHLDLKGINHHELIRLGIPKDQIEKARFNTFDNEGLFFSARRQSENTGRMLTGIMLVDE